MSLRKGRAMARSINPGGIDDLPDHAHRFSQDQRAPICRSSSQNEVHAPRWMLAAAPITPASPAQNGLRARPGC